MPVPLDGGGAARGADYAACGTENCDTGRGAWGLGPGQNRQHKLCGRENAESGSRGKIAGVSGAVRRDGVFDAGY